MSDEFKVSKSFVRNLAAGIFIAWLALGVIPRFFFCDWASAGTFGDTFGAVNALFSGFALAGVVIAILLQRQELTLQREELTATREELKRTAAAQEKSQQALEGQVQMQLTTAKLNALNLLIEAATREWEAESRTVKKLQIHKRRDRLLSRVQTMLSDIDGGLDDDDAPADSSG